MSWLPYLRRDDLDEQGQKIWDGLTRMSDLDVVNDHGGLVGPFNAFVHAPVLGTRLSQLGGLLRSAMSIERRLVELAIITVGAHWRAEFEWWAHARMASDAGVPQLVIDAIARGETPPFDDDTDRAVYALARQLAETGSLDDETYAKAHGLLGDRAVVELVFLCGYYTLISFTLNAFDVPLPEGAAPQWDQRGIRN